ncbi:MAG: ABC transporter substrate-binding protein [Actinomycetota bacterium]|nr:ABC transporter substrate-binding protein [Actinomycetota bacterium]
MRTPWRDPAVGGALTTFGVVGLVALLLSLATVVSDDGRPVVAGAGPSDAETVDLADDTAVESTEGSASMSGAAPGAPKTGSARAVATGTAGGASTAGGQAAAGGGQSCARGSNGGATDVGVTADQIKLAATVVADGPGSSFLGPVRTAMTTVVNKVNRRGGICGRRLELILRNDSWDGDRGQQYLKNFVEGEKVFALAVVPSSEGLRNADEYIASKQVPVVGTDGMLIHQYRNPWIWPVATSTISAMHVMVHNAHQRGSKDFAIVFDAKYHFGVEGAYAYNQAVKRITGHDIPGYESSLKSCGGGNTGPESERARFCGIQPGKPSYSGDARAFNNACFQSGTKTCDFIAYLLEPDTAVAFIGEGRDADPQVGMGAAQPLFTRSFAERCGSICNGMWVWTGYNPPIEALATRPGVAQYVSDVRVESASADVANQFLEGGYQGMSLLVHALEKVGPNLTRQSLKAVLDSTTFDSGLSSPLTWRPGNHFANASAQAFEILYKSSFAGWRQKTEFIADPWVGQDIPEGE